MIYPSAYTSVCNRYNHFLHYHPIAKEIFVYNQLFKRNTDKAFCFNLLRYPCRFFPVTRFRFIIFPKYKPTRPQASGAGNLHNDSPQHRDTYTVF